MKKKKTIIIISIIVILLAAAGIWSQGRQDGSRASTGGLLEERGDDKSSHFAFNFDTLVDVQFEAQFTSNSGPVQYHMICSINDEVVFEKEESNVSSATVTSKTFKNQKGTMKLEFIIPDDAEGEYTLEIRTKQTNLTKTIELFKDIFRKKKE